MAKVAILVPYQEMCEMARPLVDEYRYIEIMCLEYIQTGQVESRARQLEEGGCELIVARGVHAGIIKHSVKVPLVEIRVTAQELGMVMLDIKRQLGADRPRIGLLGFSNMFCDTKPFDVTFESYSYALKHFEQYFKGQRIGMIGANDLKRFFIWMVNYQEADGTYKYSQATLKLTKYIVGRMFSNAVEENYLQENPMDNAKLKSILKNLYSKKKTPGKKSLTPEEIGILKNALMKNKIVYPVIALMSVTGMRTQEALGLQWGDIDFDNASITIQRAVTESIVWDERGNKVSSKSVLGPTKQGTGDRVIEVPDTVLNLLKEWRATAPHISKTKLGATDRVFGNTKGSSWTYAGFRSSVNRTLQKSDTGMDSLRLHRLRRTVATMMSNEPDANVYHIMQLLGHKQIKTTQGYIDDETKERGEKNKEILSRLSAKGGLL